MDKIAYTVIATLPDETIAGAYVEWLRHGHVAAVVAGGAEAGAIVAIDEPRDPIRVETRYVFPSKAAFERYVCEVAPVLRAEGLARFGPDKKVSMERRVGRIL